MPPTFTPATPAAGPYHLRAWIATGADGLVGLVHSWLEAISHKDEYQSGYGFAVYEGQFAIANHAEDEALLRFPSAPQVSAWNWERAHDMAVANGAASAVTENYAQLMMGALNSGQVSPDTLPAWFSSHEAEIAVTLTPLPAPNGYQASYIVEAVSPTCADCKLGAHWWMVEKDGQYTVYGLKSNLYWYTEAGGSFRAIDLTGDGYPELMLDYGEAHTMGIWTSHYIYDLSHVPAQTMTVIDQYNAPVSLSAPGDSHIAAQDAATDRPGFVYTETVGDENSYYCDPVSVQTFDWTGERFVETRITYALDPDNIDAGEPVCRFLKDKRTTSEEVEALLPVLPRSSGITSVQQQDQTLFSLAEFYARTGKTEAALALFQQETDHPYAPANNPYPSAAKAILQNYHAASDFYRACLKVLLCDKFDALIQLVRGLYGRAYPQSLEALRQAGVPLLATGQFDFTGDQSSEFWFVTQDPGETQPEFWVLARVNSGAQALWVAKVSSLQPELGYWTAFGLPRLISINRQILFNIAQTRDGAKDIVRNYYKGDTRSVVQRSGLDQAWDDFRAVEGRLLGGGSPSQALAELGKLQPVLTGNCQYRTCDEFYYVLGLANELAKNDQAAVSAYLKLWNTYPDSPYMIMARAKPQPIAQ